MRMLKYFMLILIVLSAGCAFSRNMTLVAGAKGAEYSGSGTLESGQVVYNAETLGCFLWSCK